ncbi:MAG: PcfB family protein [Butyrivibrio sp.]|uniref:PcfB family protein n=1 Tax=Butyrivibrio sp. TaxID=28121 RepID=UPI001B204B61|nr:PcfB family protein [Butyrivibrio sp.]MBO6241990.1 PcfB family protein [Butyrivibrio sp.]
MNEEVAAKYIAFCYRASKVTTRTLIKGLVAFLRHVDSKSKAPKQGKMTVKQLIRQGQGASAMEIGGESIRTFKRIANKYGVDFAIVKDKTSDPPRYTCFFKAKDIDAISAVVKEYSAKVVNREQREKPSLIQQLRKLKEQIAKQPRRVKEKFKEKAR